MRPRSSTAVALVGNDPDQAGRRVGGAAAGHRPSRAVRALLEDRRRGARRDAARRRRPRSSRPAPGPRCSRPVRADEHPQRAAAGPAVARVGHRAAAGRRPDAAGADRAARVPRRRWQGRATRSSSPVRPRTASRRRRPGPGAAGAGPRRPQDWWWPPRYGPSSRSRAPARRRRRPPARRRQPRPPRPRRRLRRAASRGGAAGDPSHGMVEARVRLEGAAHPGFSPSLRRACVCGKARRRTPRAAARGPGR